MPQRRTGENRSRQGPHRKAHREPFCSVVQRQRNPGALLDPSEEGPDYEVTPCLAPLAAWRKDVHVLSGVDNAAASGKGNGHTNSMSGLMTGTDFTGRGPSGPSIDQIIAAKIGAIRVSVLCRSVWLRSRSAKACSAT